MDEIKIFQVFLQLAVDQEVASAKKIEGWHVVGGRGAGIVKVDEDVLVHDQLVECGQHIPAEGRMELSATCGEIRVPL